jgi:hypothetical protein
MTGVQALMPFGVGYVGYGEAKLSAIFLAVISIIVAWSIHYFCTHHTRLPGTLVAIVVVAAFFGSAWGIKWATDAQAPRWPEDAPKASIDDLETNPININKATREELQTIPGVGSITAHRIIKNRPFSEVSDVATLKGITRDNWELMKDCMTVGNNPVQN